MIGGQLEQQAPNFGRFVARATIVGPPQRTVETLHVLDEQRAARTCVFYQLGA